MSMQTIGERIIFLRENIDLSQIKLANKIGITKMTLSKYEHDINEPRGEIIARLAKALNTTTDFLLGLTNDPAPHSSNSAVEYAQKAENELLIKFRHLTDGNKAKIEERVDILLEQQNQ